MIENYLEIELAGETFQLLPQKAVYRPAKKQLILTDIHLGKATHFRKQGIALPVQSHLKDIDKIHFLLNQLNPGSVLILGDLFHSDYNREWLWIKSLLMEYPDIKFILVEGNHDILKHEIYNLPNLSKTERIEEENLVFTHEPLKAPDKLNFCGHIHPGYVLYGKAKQSMKLPCFYSTKSHFILPAFGNLTGLYVLEKDDQACYYLVTETRIIEHRN